VNLQDIGLRGGERVRYRRRADKRWQEGTAEGVERDGSLALRDGKGASRAIPIERVEVRTTGPRGGWVWESLAERAARAEQLDLF
jgi:hypothetical protein